MQPLISVVMAVYEPKPLFLQQALESVLNQSLGDFEFIIVEDPSSSPGQQIVNECDDARIRYLLNDRRTSLVEQKNRGLACVRGSYVAIMDADDISDLCRFEKQIAFLRTHPDVDVLGSQVTVIDQNGASLGYRRFPLDHQPIVRAMRRVVPLCHPSVMLRREPLLRVGGYRETGYPIEDYELWSRLAKHQAHFANHPDALLKYRVHPNQTKAKRLRECIRGVLCGKTVLASGNGFPLAVADVGRAVAALATARHRVSSAVANRVSPKAAITMESSHDRPSYDRAGRPMLAGRAPRAADFAKLILDTCRPFLACPVEELRVLDVGCGYGHTTLELAKRSKHVVGIEPSQPLYRHASELAATAGRMNLAMCAVAVEDLDDVESYDLVVLDNVFEHLPNQRLSLAKIRTCMGPQGILFMLVPNKLWPIEVHYRLPLLSYLPLPLANVYLRCSRRGVDYRDASYAPTYFSLNRLLRAGGGRAPLRAARRYPPGDVRAPPDLPLGCCGYPTVPMALDRVQGVSGHCEKALKCCPCESGFTLAGLHALFGPGM